MTMVMITSEGVDTSIGTATIQLAQWLPQQVLSDRATRNGPALAAFGN
jgi:hypothetical protein